MRIRKEIIHSPEAQQILEKWYESGVESEQVCTFLARARTTVYNYHRSGWMPKKIATRIIEVDARLQTVSKNGNSVEVWQRVANEYAINEDYNPFDRLVQEDNVPARLRLGKLLTLFPFQPKKTFGLPANYRNKMGVVWGPPHLQTLTHQADDCRSCYEYFQEHPDERQLFIGKNENWREHAARKYVFHRFVYFYVLYAHAGFDVTDYDIKYELGRYFRPKVDIPKRYYYNFNSNLNNPHFPYLVTMYSKKLLETIGEDVGSMCKKILIRMKNMAVPEGGKEIMKTDEGKRKALLSLAYLVDEDLSEAIAFADGTQRVRLQEGNRSIELPANWSPPTLPSPTQNEKD